MYSRIQLQIIAAFAAHLAFKSFSKEDFRTQFSCSREALDKAISMLRRPAHRCIYICGWLSTPDKTGRSYPRPVFAFGNRPDKPKPLPKSAAHRQALKRLKQKHPLPEKTHVATLG